MTFNPPLDANEVRTAFGNRYATLTEVKVGGQGAVFCGVVATNPAAGSKVALKIYFTGQLKERTEREIAALQAINAESLVKLVGYGRIVLRGVTCTWLETAFVEGDSLAARIAKAPLSVQAASRVAVDIAVAIDLIWNPHRVVHRDIKPDNIMVTPQGRAVLIDLGVARHTAMASLTTHGVTWGTMGYMSPEQYKAHRGLSCHSDIFALGLVVQHSILGHHPTNGDQDKLLQGGPSTALLRNNLPAEFVALIDEMVREKPYLRPLPRTAITRLMSLTH